MPTVLSQLMGSDSLFKPILKQWRNILGDTGHFFWSPFIDLWRQFCKLDNACLYCCGFFFIFGSLNAAYLAILLAVLLIEFLIILIISLLIGLSFILVGIWPAFICIFGITGIVIIRTPKNIFNHFMVTYRTVVLTKSLKILSFLLIPFAHLLAPLITFLVCLVAFPPICILISFSGFPLKPWEFIKENHQNAWKVFATQVDQFAENYGHWSGWIFVSIKI